MYQTDDKAINFETTYSIIENDKVQIQLLDNQPIK